MDDQNPNIFIVEDEAIIADEIAVLIRNHGYQVSGKASSGEEALIKINEKSPDLILMDVHLNGKLNGIETAEKINAINNIPVIFITAYPDEVTNNPSYLNHPYACLNKPFQEKDFLCQVTATFQQRENIKRLNHYSQWLQNILSSMTTGFVTITPENKIEYMNVIAEKMLNQSANELYHKNSSALFNGLNCSTEEKLNINTLTKHYSKPFNMKFTGFTLENSLGSIELKANPYFDENGTFEGTLIELNDIHHVDTKIINLKDALDQLHLAKEMQEENAANLVDIVETMNIENNQLKDVIQYFELYYNTQLEKINNQLTALYNKTKNTKNMNTYHNKFSTEYKDLTKTIQSSLSYFNFNNKISPDKKKSIHLHSMLREIEDTINKDFGKYFKTAFFYGLNLPQLIIGDQKKLENLFFYLIKQTLQITNVYDIMFYIKKLKHSKKGARLQFQITIRGKQDDIEQLPNIYKNVKIGSTIKKFSSLHEFCLIQVVNMITQLLDGTIDYEYPSKEHWDSKASITIKFTFPFDLPKNINKDILDHTYIKSFDKKLISSGTRQVIFLGSNNFLNQQIKHIFNQLGLKCNLQSNYQLTLEEIAQGNNIPQFLIIDINNEIDFHLLYSKGYLPEASKKTKIILLIDIMQHFESLTLQKRFHAHATIFKPVSTYELIKLIRNMLLGHPEELKNGNLEKIDFNPNENSQELDNNNHKNVFKPGMILVAEKNEVNIKIMEAFLRIRGWQVLTVSDHDSIIDYVKENPVDLIMISYEMALYEDFLALDILKKRLKKAGKKIPLILMKEKEQSSFETLILQKNVDGILEHPIKAENIHNLIHQQLKNNPEYNIPLLDKMTLMGSAYGDMEILKEISSYFIQSIPEEMHNLKQLAKENKWSDLADKAHQWRGSVSQFGAVEATKLLNNLEEASELHDEKEVKQLISQINQEMEKLCDFFSVPGWEKFI